MITLSRTRSKPGTEETTWIVFTLTSTNNSNNSSNNSNSNNSSNSSNSNK